MKFSRLVLVTALALPLLTASGANARNVDQAPLSDFPKAHAQRAPELSTKTREFIHQTFSKSIAENAKLRDLIQRTEGEVFALSTASGYSHEAYIQKTDELSKLRSLLDAKKAETLATVFDSLTTEERQIFDRHMHPPAPLGSKPMHGPQGADAPRGPQPGPQGADAPRGPRMGHPGADVPRGPKCPFAKDGKVPPPRDEAQRGPAPQGDELPPPPDGALRGPSAQGDELPPPPDGAPRGFSAQGDELQLPPPDAEQRGPDASVPPHGIKDAPRHHKSPFHRLDRGKAPAPEKGAHLPPPDAKGPAPDQAPVPPPEADDEE